MPIPTQPPLVDLGIWKVPWMLPSRKHNSNLISMFVYKKDHQVYKKYLVICINNLFYRPPKIAGPKAPPTPLLPLILPLTEDSALLISSFKISVSRTSRVIMDPNRSIPNR